MTTTKKRGLGRGLSALLDEPAADIRHRADGALGVPERTAGSIGSIPIARIEPNPFQPRSTFSEEALTELASSIRELGVIQPVTVRKVGPDRYQLISGERRFRAAKRAGLTEIPAYVRIANDEAMLEMALVENIQREELDPIEVAISFQRLVEELKLTQEELGTRVGKDRTTVTNYLRLLRLAPEVQLGLRQRVIGMGHARALIAIADPVRQTDIYRRIVESQLSVRQVEDLVRTDAKGPNAGRSGTHLDKELGRRLSERVGGRVKVRQAVDGHGRIEIAFKSGEELRRIVEAIGA